MRSALLARLPLLAGLRFLVLRLEEIFVLPAFAFALPELPVLPLVALVSRDVGAFFLLDVGCFVGGS
jgi:hypothetical protein